MLWRSEMKWSSGGIKQEVAAMDASGNANENAILARIIASAVIKMAFVVLCRISSAFHMTAK